MSLNRISKGNYRLIIGELTVDIIDDNPIFNGNDYISLSKPYIMFEGTKYKTDMKTIDVCVAFNNCHTEEQVLEKLIEICT